MNESKAPLDLDLWLDAALVSRQNLLKNQFLSVLEETGIILSKEELDRISPRARGVKISKGNDLLGFPYQVLDVVRDFDPYKGVNIRMLNWFGNGLFVAVLLGKEKSNPIDKLLENGMTYSLSENQWDYPDMILNKNLTDDRDRIVKSNLGFHHWIKRIALTPDPENICKNLVSEAKKILGILALLKE
jgi:hypothetical protein